DSLKEEKLDTEAHKKWCAELMLTSLEQLNDIETPFQLLLLDDSEQLEHRINALSAWCQAYLCGLGLAGLSSSNIKDGEIEEVLKDIAQIASIKPCDGKIKNKDETNFEEITEHVRICVLLIYTTMHPKTEKETGITH
ncbi:unnamed protein product, partial [marine sediment metagenome]